MQNLDLTVALLGELSQLLGQAGFNGPIGGDGLERVGELLDGPIAVGLFAAVGQENAGNGRCVWRIYDREIRGSMG